jgi:hypothetical protein
MFSWMLALKLTQFQIFMRVCLDNNYQSIHHDQGCHKGRFWVKMTVQTSISSIRPFSSSRCPRPLAFTPPDAVLPADGFLPRSCAVKLHPCGRKPRPR